MTPKPMFKEGGVSLDDLKKPQEEMIIQKEVPPAPEPVPETPPEKEVVPEAPPETPAEVPPVEAPPETPPAEPALNDPATIQKSGENFEFLNTLLKKEFKSKEEVEEAFNKPTMESEYNELKAQNEKLQSDYDLLMEHADPMSYFSSEEAMKLELWKKQNPDKDASIAQVVFGAKDLNAVSDLNMVKMGRKFTTPNLPGTEKDLEDAIAMELGVEQDIPIEEWPKTAHIRLATLAGDYRERFKTIKGSVELPAKVDLEELRTQRQAEADARKVTLTEEWGKYSKEVATGLNSLKIPLGEPKEGEEQAFFEWDVSAPEKEVVDRLSKDYITLGVPSTDKMKEAFEKSVRLELIDKNLSRMMKKYGDDQLARQEEKHLEELHNPAPLKDSDRPKDGTAEQKTAERTAFAIGGGGASIFNHPLFNITKSE